ncbi:MAG: FAD-dependent oxidoreductase [Methylocella sp.]
MAENIEIAVVGAGPFGLSLAAHLRAQDLKFRIFGAPMQTWRDHMPIGMMLKSDGFASNLSDPDGTLTLEAYCVKRGIAYRPFVPVALSVFTDYALEFQRRLVPSLDERTIVNVDQTGNGFRLWLDDGEPLEARRVVLAVGISHFAHMPGALRNLPHELVSHSSAHKDVSALKGKEVVVIGAGASAAELAALLTEKGAKPQLVTRAGSMRFYSKPKLERELWEKLRHPSSGIGPGLKSRLFADFPGLFRHLPPQVRLMTIRKHLGPASAYHLKDRVVGRVPLVLEQTLADARAEHGRVELFFRTKDGGRNDIVADHVIAATGYRTDLRRLRFLSDSIRTHIRQFAHSPVLSANFESSVRDLYFLGLATSMSFGPVMRFVFGSDFAARRLSRHLSGLSR